MILELFPCSGGMAEGLRRAGIHIDMAFDWSSDACDSYEQNHGRRPVQIDVRDLLRMARAGWRPGPIDLLIADPPCTPWSRAGKRLGTADERDMLGVTVELIAELRPAAYLIANVPGLDDAPNWPIVQREIGGLARYGYCVADFVRLDAATFATPQHRIRPFWFGHKIGTPCIQWPQRTHGSPEECTRPSLPGLPHLRPWVTVREALAHLPPEEMGRPVRLRWKQYDPSKGAHKPSEPDAPSRTVTRNANGDGVLIRTVSENGHPTSQWDEPSLTIPASRPGNGASLVANPKHPISTQDAPAYTILASDRGERGGIVEWPWDRPSTVVCSGEVLSPPKRSGRDGTSQRGNPNAIVLSEKAAAILQGFPPGWRFCGRTKASRWSQIGQAMPAPLAEAVGRQIRKWMEGQCCRHTGS